MRLSKKSMIVIAVSVALVAAAAASLIFFLSGRAKRADLKYLRQADYNAVFFSMVPYEDVGGEAVGEDFFSLYLGLHPECRGCDRLSGGRPEQRE